MECMTTFNTDGRDPQQLGPAPQPERLSVRQFLVVEFLLVLFSFFALCDWLEQPRNWESATARVLAVRRDDLKVVVGDRHLFVSHLDVGESRIPRVGESIGVLVDPDNPSSARLDLGFSGDMTVSILLGVCALGVAIHRACFVTCPRHAAPDADRVSRMRE
jgi:hypothetical protein